MSPILAAESPPKSKSAFSIPSSPPRKLGLVWDFLLPHGSLKNMVARFNIRPRSITARPLASSCRAPSFLLLRLHSTILFFGQHERYRKNPPDRRRSGNRHDPAPRVDRGRLFSSGRKAWRQWSHRRAERLIR